MSPKKLPPIGLIPIGALMGGTAEPPLAEIEHAKARVHQDSYRAAMLQQRKTKPDTFPVGNRAARRLAQSKKGEKPL